MSLIIEDGSIVSGANSFTTDAEFVAYAAARGYTIPSTETERDILQIQAVDYLAGLEDQFQGRRTDSAQDLAFPRIGVCLYGYVIESNSIPVELKNAQLELAHQVNTEQLLTNETVSGLTGFTVDGVYSESYGSSGSKSKTLTRKANAYLSALFEPVDKLIRT